MGIEPGYKGPLEPVYKAALSLGIANQLTNVLRDVGEDIEERNRIYLPLQELQRFDITEAEVSISHFCTAACWSEVLLRFSGASREFIRLSKT